MASVGRKRRAFVRAFPEGQGLGDIRDEIEDPNVESGPAAGGEGDLVERRRRPGGPIAVRLGRLLREIQAVNANDVDLRRAAAVRRERDLRS